MTECDNAEVRDLLPDYVSERLAAGEQARVQAHIDTCTACDDEVGLLRAMRAARPVAARVDIERIVSALPRPSTLRLVPSDGAQSPRTTRSPLLRSPLLRSPLVRMAAAVGVAALGGWGVLANRTTAGAAGTPSVQVAAGVERAPDSVSTVPGAGRTPERAPDSGAAMTVAMADTPRAGGAAGGAATSRTAAVGTRATALSLGDLSEYSDDDLQRMLDRLDKWDGATSADPIPTVPIIPVTERGTR